MAQRTWLLDIALVHLARQCSTQIQQEFGQRLPLAHSDFLGKVQSFAEKSDSLTLKKTSRDLLDRIAQTLDEPPEEPVEDVEMTHYMGKAYPRWHEGREFSGLYRGAPVYKDPEPTE